MARQTAVDVGNFLGELIAIDWKDRFGGWIEFMRLQVKIDVSKPLRRVVKLVDKDGVETIGVIKDENGQNEYKGKESSCEEESLSISPMYRINQNNMGDGMGKFKSGGWRSALPRAMKIFCWNCRGVGNLAIVRELKQLLVANGPNVAFLCETKIHSNSFSRIHSIYRMKGCLPVSSEGKRGGLALLWREEVKVEVERGGRRKSRASMDGFRDILEELSLVDVKTGNGWFTWSNNREGAYHVKERLDRFLVSEDLIENLPFISTNVVRQSKSDHEEILLNTHRNKPIDKGSDYRTCFKYDVCWAKDQEARDLISRV
ncbi:hypothetical protein GOBAR_DD06312 [Gossypium barbadense]|nr:hypothetical protein GOBAR_DD06312 [Gossypium barbadense]